MQNETWLETSLDGELSAAQQCLQHVALPLMFLTQVCIRLSRLLKCWILVQLHQAVTEATRPLGNQLMDLSRRMLPLLVPVSLHP
ncbi:Os01g0795050 [Oryza sativa Japonica Group]|uniref:Os01g0795050 protein n=1 Tax=Oryza sativa subsp. japonica TaxID=39947 RepID=A0A0P0V957_ORYSJ|nr:hypothetical protein EE612_006255 [Oryza sativa]BAS74746.1 Os01g0795050 [Oryza sativa Japonica Group]